MHVVCVCLKKGNKEKKVYSFFIQVRVNDFFYEQRSTRCGQVKKIGKKTNSVYHY